MNLNRKKNVKLVPISQQKKIKNKTTIINSEIYL